MKTKKDKRFSKILFSQKQIEKKIKELANWINKEYKDSKGNTVVYQRLVFTVNNLDEKAETTVYVYNKLDSQYYSHYYTVEANFYNLYNYLVECGLNS